VFWTSAVLAALVALGSGMVKATLFGFLCLWFVMGTMFVIGWLERDKEKSVLAISVIPLGLPTETECVMRQDQVQVDTASDDQIYLSLNGQEVSEEQSGKGCWALDVPGIPAPLVIDVEYCRDGSPDWSVLISGLPNGCKLVKREEVE